MKLTTILSWFGLWRRPARVADLRFPVIVIRADGATPFVAVSADGLLTRDARSGAILATGATLIDTAFRQYVLRDVHARRRTDFALIFSYLFPIKVRVKYRFDLRRRWSRSPAAARKRLARSGGVGTGEIERRERRLAAQSTLAGMISVLDGSLSAPMATYGEPAVDQPPYDGAAQPT